MQKGKNCRKMKMLRHVVLSCILLLGLITIVGTGGGGGGGGGPTGLTYIGLTTPALIDENNAQPLASGVVTGGSLGPEFAIGAVQDNGADENGLSLFEVAQLLQNSLTEVDFSSISAIYQGATFTDSGTDYGACGGSITYNISGDDQTGNFTGSFTFTNYCESGATISGSVSFSGKINLDTDSLINYQFTFNNLTVNDGSFSATLDGTIRFVVDIGPPAGGTITMNVLIRDNSTGKVYRFDNLVIVATDGFDGNDFTQLSFTGRFYDPDYGYVDITTPILIKIYLFDEWPTECVVEIFGANGTKARLTALNNTQCRVEADVNGDGAYAGPPEDYDSGPISWSNL